MPGGGAGEAVGLRVPLVPALQEQHLAPCLHWGVPWGGCVQGGSLLAVGEQEEELFPRRDDHSLSERSLLLAEARVSQGGL